MQRTFATPAPTSVYVEIGSGQVDVRAGDVAETRIDVNGDGADETVVEQRGDQIVVIGPKLRLGLFRSSPGLSVQVSMPVDSELATLLGSADLRTSGRLGAARLKTGSGDIDVEEIAGEASLTAGSGDIEIGTASGKLKVRSGSGGVSLGRLDAETDVATGSGDIQVKAAAAPVRLKSGSGDARVGTANADLDVTTASGDVSIDRFDVGALQAKLVSGDLRVGIPAGVPVWTDVTTVTGRIASSLDSAGEPAEGEPFIELRATTVSGDILLEQR